MSPKQLLGALEIFEDEDMKKKLMQSCIRAFKEVKTDIRAFNVN